MLWKPLRALRNNQPETTIEKRNKTKFLGTFGTRFENRNDQPEYENDTIQYPWVWILREKSVGVVGKVWRYDLFLIIPYSCIARSCAR